MKSKSTTSGGYWMLIALTVMLAIPPVVGHFLMHSDANASVAVKAEAQQ